MPAGRGVKGNRQRISGLDTVSRRDAREVARRVTRACRSG
jgi:hypothetical protein